jgi:hypothetical protein
VHLSGLSIRGGTRHFYPTVDTFQSNPISKMTALVKKFYIDLVVVYIAAALPQQEIKYRHTLL